MFKRLKHAALFVQPEFERTPQLRGAVVAATLAVGARRRDRVLLAAATGILTFECAHQGQATRRAVSNGTDSAALTAWLPAHGMEFGGYAVDADLAAVLRSHVRHGGHRSIVEFGAGLSTLTMAWALEELGVEGAIVSFEANRDFADQVTAMLADAKLSDRARVIHAPLGRHVVNGRGVHWHDPDLVHREAPAGIDLLFVDGPVSVDTWSRWPALELLWGQLGPGSVALLDDSRRRREHQCAVRWASAHPELRLSWIDTITGVCRAEVGHTPRERGLSRCLHAVLRAVNPRPAGWGKWPVRRM
jgi:predicted O-methyltransferase YrrM